MKKKLLSAALAVAMALSVVPGAFAAEAVTASPTNDKLTVDGVERNPTVYKIGDSNYFKIRDFAAVLNGTGKQFSVGYDGEKQSVTATPGQPYELTGTELTGAASSGQTAQASSDAIYVNGQRVEAEVYKIDGSNYFKLRDLGAALGFEVNWTAERGMTIETGGGSQPTEKTPLEQIQGIWYGKDEEVQGEANEQEYKIEGDRLFQISYIDMYYYMEGTIVGIELEDGLYAIKLKDCKGINVSTSDTTIYDRGSWKEDTIYLDLQSNMLTDVTLDIVLSPASALQLYPRFQAALEAAQSKPSAPDDTDINPMDYAYTAMEYLYDHLKFPSTMDVSAVKCGKHVSNHIFEKTDNVYVVTITYKAANSFGALRTSNYVTMFNLTTGKTMFDAVGYTESMIDGSWGAAKFKAYKKNIEALGLSGGGTLSTELTREQIQSLVDQIKK